MQAEASIAAMSFYELSSMSFRTGNIQLTLSLYFQLKPVSTTVLLADTQGSASYFVTGPAQFYLFRNALAVLLNLVVTRIVRKRRWWSVDQLTPLTTKRSSKESQDTEEI